MLAYFDCFSGISGDMTLGAFFDLGVPVDWLKVQIERLPLEGFGIDVAPVQKSGIQGKSVRVVTENPAEPRPWKTIRLLIRQSRFSEEIKTDALKIFERIAVAEAHIHGCAVEEVHFHEIGGLDAIVDIVGTVLCLDYLGIRRVAASKMPVSGGLVQCEHGVLPVPAPATLEILKGVPIYGTDISAETVTPTGAAIVAALAESFGPMPEMTVQDIGYGAGERDIETVPNLLRIVTGKTLEPLPHLARDRVVVLETCIDDMNPEIFGFLMEKLFEEGALDLWWVPAYMKKNRPGTLVQVLCPPERQAAVIRRIVRETSTTGVRHYQVERTRLRRRTVWVETRFGKIRVKQIGDPLGGRRCVPEYEVCKKIAVEKRIPIRDVYAQIERDLDRS